MEDEAEKQQQSESGHCSHHYGTALRGVKTSLDQHAYPTDKSSHAIVFIQL